MTRIVSASGTITQRSANRNREREPRHPGEEHADPDEGVEAQTELTGQALPMIAARTSVTMPSNSSQPLPGSRRSSNDSTNSSTPWSTR